jgi:hypothetical protein
MEDQDRPIPPIEYGDVPFLAPDHDLPLTLDLGFKYRLIHQGTYLQQKLQDAEIMMRKVIYDNTLCHCILIFMP